MSHIAGIGCCLPSARIENEDVIDLVRFYSRDLQSCVLLDVLEQSRLLLSKSGSNTRFWRTKFEHPADMIASAVQYSLTSAKVTKTEIDLLLYVSVDRGFIEPANASVMAKQLGLPGVRAFDISDACMGWWTGIQAAQSLLRSTSSKFALIVSVECPMGVGQALLPGCFSIRHPKEIDYKFPALTFGEAVTATVLFSDDQPSWENEIISDNMLADLCVVPYRDYNHIFDQNQRVDLSENGHFVGFGRLMGEKGFRNGLRALQNLLSRVNPPTAIIPHTFSEPLPHLAAKKLGVEDKIYSTFPLFGNIATSAIPTALYRGLLRQDFHVSDRLVGWIASAGLKFAAFEIRLS